MKEPIDYLSTLFVGIDIASRIHVISALDFNEKFYIKMKSVENSQAGAVLIEQMISDVLPSVQIRCHCYGSNRFLRCPSGELPFCQ